MEILLRAIRKHPSSSAWEGTEQGPLTAYGALLLTLTEDVPPQLLICSKHRTGLRYTSQEDFRLVSLQLKKRFLPWILLIIPF